MLDKPSVAKKKLGKNNKQTNMPNKLSGEKHSGVGCSQLFFHFSVVFFFTDEILQGIASAKV